MKLQVADLLASEKAMLSTEPSLTFRVHDKHTKERQSEPIYLLLPHDIDVPLIRMKTEAGTSTNAQWLCADRETGGNVYVASLTFSESDVLTYSGVAEESDEGIRTLDTFLETDCVAHLDTGYFDLELCRGTAQGEGSSKWGLRHFKALAEGKDLLESGNNAIGGFYGPFFTPENGLINPPEHTIAHVDVLAKGPVQHRYRLSGTVPAGLLPELRARKFEIDWVFTYGTPFFMRRYEVEDFTTTINGRTVKNKITVGDEFEAGQGDVVFNRFESYGATPHRAGDPYALHLVDAVEQVLLAEQDGSDKLQVFRTALEEDITGAHWDLYWRMFCFWEQALSEDELKTHLAEVQRLSHLASDDPHTRPWICATESVTVPAAADATIFAGPADKTAEYSTESGYAMVWWTSEPSGAFQIVQRESSGWVNWGSNGENECPELPVGVDIKTAYGPFGANWEPKALELETPPTVVGL